MLNPNLNGRFRKFRGFFFIRPTHTPETFINYVMNNIIAVKVFVLSSEVFSASRGIKS